MRNLKKRRNLLLGIIFLITVFVSPLIAQDSLWIEQTVPFENGMLNAVTYINPDTGWAVGRDDGNNSAAIIRTTNAGNDWIQQTSGVIGDLKSIFMINESVGFTVGQNWDNGNLAILKTTNSGENWDMVTPPDNFSSLNDIEFQNATNGITVGINISSNKILILYTIDGNNWLEAEVPDINAHLMKVCFSDEQTAFAVGTYWETEIPYVLRSTDGGATWAELSHGITNGIFMDIDFVNPNLGWISGGIGNDELLLQTSSGGEDWKIVEIRNNNEGMFKNSAFLQDKQKIQSSGITPLSDGKVGVTSIIQTQMDDGSYSHSISGIFINPDSVAADVTSNDELPDVETVGFQPYVPAKNGNKNNEYLTICTSGKEGKPRLYREEYEEFVIEKIGCTLTIIKKLGSYARPWYWTYLEVEVYEGEYYVNGIPTGIYEIGVCRLEIYGDNYWKVNVLDASALNSSECPNLESVELGRTYGHGTFYGAEDIKNDIYFGDGDTYAYGGTKQDTYHLWIYAGTFEITENGGDDKTIFYKNSSPAKLLDKSQMDEQANTFIKIIDEVGIDTLDFNQYDHSVVLDMDLVNVDQIFAPGETLHLSGQFENFIGSPKDDKITVSALDVPRVIDGGGAILGDTLFFDAKGNQIQTEDGWFYVEGYDTVFYTNFEKIILLNDPTSVDSEGTIPTEYKLFQNYPNPFNPTTTIRYEIPNESVRTSVDPNISPSNRLQSGQHMSLHPVYVKLAIFDITGSEIKTLVNEHQNPGIYEIIFNAKDLPSGIYFYRLETGNSSTSLSAGQAGSGQGFVDTKKFILLK